ncbi:MAG: 23S rRNA (cytidine(2498)-2'-O)-methyltransferase RlmM [Nitrospirae bacterium]|nr:23S rRNA (cytidine(2498)-2'-O)-methyltransferase RlmM [Magnetococcales bacterium]HAT51311.1 23S rRNA (cytidine(2498)-2'-O)-methyltransferase RlmM [Alphaproteobacteria bacterium]
MDTPLQLFAFCRGGFEQECQNELETVLEKTGIVVNPRTTPGLGYCLLTPKERHDGDGILQKFSFQNLIFARHVVAVDEGLPPLTTKDRLSPLRHRLQGLSQRVGPFSQLWLGWPDHEASRVLAPLCRTLTGRLEAMLREDGVWESKAGGPRGEVVFLTGTSALTGYSLPFNSAHWPMGLPRLRIPSNAPSRSALKLEEALLWFASQGGTNRPVLPRQTAVDLGAAPGGWTWAMVQRGIAVTAVDRGRMAEHVAASPLVRHVREDGFRFRPDFKPDWLLCDIIDKPRKVADLVAQWADNGWCRNAIFNLKLPMKKRREEVALCRDRMTETLVGSGRPFHLRFRQLYHDREEVTGFLKLGK